MGLIKKHWPFGADKQKRWKLKPVPVMPDSFTLGEAEAICAVLNVDIDLILSGDIRSEDLTMPKRERAKEFLRLVCENGDKYDPAEWTAQQYRGVMVALVANFIYRSAVN
ncbi:MAG TPA: hypothetical protein VKN76_12405 [Kiloniellaceae bacterium]|nr:hypothetical protein [Kiloniellaceae bacterium]